MKNDYLFNNTLAGTAIVEEKDDHLEMHDETKIFHDELRQVNDEIVIGKYYSETKFALGWLPSEGMSFLHIDASKINHISAIHTKENQEMIQRSEIDLDRVPSDKIELSIDEGY